MIIKKEFYFIRHGQTDGNILPIYYGDLSLNATGFAQAHAIESIIASLPVKTICYSPLKRAKETKDICCARLAHAVQHEVEDLTECDQDVWDRMTSLGKGAHEHLGEPVFGFMQQARRGINEALSKEGPVLIVAHGGIHWAMCSFMGVQHEWAIDNCVPVHFTLSEQGRWSARKIIHKSL